MANRDSSHVWKTDKAIRWDECFECGSKGHIHYHHIIPEIKGGKATIPLCARCHGIVHGIDYKNHGTLVKLGLQRARENGKPGGRRPDTKETGTAFLNKPKSKNIMELLNKGYGIRETARILNVSSNTVGKVKRYMQ